MSPTLIEFTTNDYKKHKFDCGTTQALLWFFDKIPVGEFKKVVFYDKSGKCWTVSSPSEVSIFHLEDEKLGSGEFVFIKKGPKLEFIK